MIGFLSLGLALAAVSESATAQSAPPEPEAPVKPAGLLGICTSCVGSISGGIGSCAKGCCNTPLGRLLNGAVKPIEMMTGGVIPAPCPDPTDPSGKDSGKDSGGGGSDGQSSGPPSPQQAAEAIKKDQAQAKARAEAVRYLATVPCHYYPEAEAALVTALRTDRSECVRWEAAHALAQGCCCTKKTVEALKIVVSGSDKDGNPSEKSFRVQVEALNALEHCLAMCGDTLQTPQRPEAPAHIPEPETVPTPLPQPKRPEVPAGQYGPASAVQPVNYYEEVEKRPSENLLAEARRLVESTRRVAGARHVSRGGNSLVEIWRRTETPADTTMETASGAVPGQPQFPEIDDRGNRPTLAPPRPTADSPASMASPTPAEPFTPNAIQSSLPYRNARPSDSAIPYSSSQLPRDYPATSEGSHVARNGMANASGSNPWPPFEPGQPQRVPVRATPVTGPAYAGQSAAADFSQPTAPPAYGQLPSASLPPVNQGVELLPPLSSNWPSYAVPSPDAPSTSAAAPAGIGSAQYRYPSTQDSAPAARHPAQVVQHPEWFDPQPLR